ncbi:hypothetical protein KGQ64_06385 [bacterium]|nr:hypothetical protein [bacterium]
MASLSLADARRIFGARLLGPEGMGRVVGDLPSPPESLSIDADLATRLAREGCALVWRATATADGRPITLARLHEATAADRSRGFKGEEPWFVDLPFAAEETPETGWAVFARAPWPETLNRTFGAGDAALRTRAGSFAWRRRRAVEIAYDCFAAAAAGERVLERAWDWSGTASTDGGLLTLGGFGDAGLEVIAYSRAVKHDALGICPTLLA